MLCFQHKTPSGIATPGLARARALVIIAKALVIWAQLASYKYCKVLLALVMRAGESPGNHGRLATHLQTPCWAGLSADRLDKQYQKMCNDRHLCWLCMASSTVKHYCNSYNLDRIHFLEQAAHNQEYIFGDIYWNLYNLMLVGTKDNQCVGTLIKSNTWY